MSEGPEVKIIADKLAAALVGKKVEDIYGKSIETEIKSDIVGNKIRNFWKKYCDFFFVWDIS